jgi:UDP-N-acetylmuramate--alanine ligase
MAEKLPAEGFLIANLSDSLIKPVVSGIRAKKIDYLKNFDPHLILRVPGDHNRKDAAVALSVAEILGLDLNKAKESLCNFAGTWRRFEFKGETKTGALVYDDYGHHPTEVNATLKGARELFPDKKIVVVFQPHLFSRTKLLLEDFAVAFSQANEILLAPIFPAREPFDVTISSSILAEKIKLHNQKAQSFASFTDIANYLFHNLKKGDVLITMGAGEQYKIGENLL